MKKIPLRNKKLENIIIVVLCAVLFVTVLLMAIENTSEWRFYGVVIDAQTSQLLLFVVSTFPLIYGVIRLLELRSFYRLKRDFVIELGYDHIYYPYPTLFKGYKINELRKESILFAKAYNPGGGKYEIHLKNYDHDIIGVIPYFNICHSNTISEQELSDEINTWLDNGDKIDPSLF